MKVYIVDLEANGDFMLVEEADLDGIPLELTDDEWADYQDMCRKVIEWHDFIQRQLRERQ